MMSFPNFDHFPVDSGTDVDKLLIHADAILINQRRSTMPISIAIMRVIREGRYGLRYLESRYRALDSPTYLLGIPSEHAPSSLIVATPKDNAPAPYFLWVCVNGHDEVETRLAELEFTEEQNLDHLDQTGFLVRKSE